MKPDRLTRVNELMRREISTVLFRVLDPQAFDLSAVTVTHVIVSCDLRAARVLISIRNHEPERQHMLRTIQHHSAEIQHRVAEQVVLKYTPRLSFALDHSLEAGDRVLHLLAGLDQAGPTATPTPTLDPHEDVDDHPAAH